MCGHKVLFWGYVLRRRVVVVVRINGGDSLPHGQNFLCSHAPVGACTSWGGVEISRSQQERIYKNSNVGLFDWIFRCGMLMGFFSTPRTHTYANIFPTYGHMHTQKYKFKRCLLSHFQFERIS